MKLQETSEQVIAQSIEICLSFPPVQGECVSSLKGYSFWMKLIVSKCPYQAANMHKRWQVDIIIYIWYMTLSAAFLY